jgi:hypothetical protein
MSLFLLLINLLNTSITDLFSYECGCKEYSTILKYESNLNFNQLFNFYTAIEKKFGNKLIDCDLKSLKKVIKDLKSKILAVKSKIKLLEESLNDEVNKILEEIGIKQKPFIELKKENLLVLKGLFTSFNTFHMFKHECNEVKGFNINIQFDNVYFADFLRNIIHIKINEIEKLEICAKENFWLLKKVVDTLQTRFLCHLYYIVTLDAMEFNFIFIYYACRFLLKIKGDEKTKIKWTDIYKKPNFLLKTLRTLGFRQYKNELRALYNIMNIFFQNSISFLSQIKSFAINKTDLEIKHKFYSIEVKVFAMAEKKCKLKNCVILDDIVLICQNHIDETIKTVRIDIKK